MEARITRHAFDRSKERIGLDKRATQRLANKALVSGLAPEDTTGDLRFYLDLEAKRRCGGGWAYVLRVYARRVFVFCDDKLVTVFNLPRNLIRSYEKYK